MHETAARPALALWPPDDTEESVLGTNLHQTTITDTRARVPGTGANEAASQEERPWQAGSQTNVAGFARPDGRPYTTLPDVFVCRDPFDLQRATLSLAEDGPPALIVEVLSDDTWKADLDLERGKPFSYRRGGVAEYLALDPLQQFTGRDGRGWRLVGGAYVPWEQGAGGRWASRLGFSVGWEGARAVVYDARGRLMPGEGQVLRAIAEGRAEGVAEGEARGIEQGLAAGEARGRAEGLLVGRAMLVRLLELRFGALPPGLEARLEALAAPAALAGLTGAAMDAPNLSGFVEALDRATG